MECPAAVVDLLRSLHHTDKDITLAINQLHCQFSDFAWQLFSNKEIWYVLYAAVAFFLFRRLGWKKALVVVGACILCIVGCDQLANFTKAAAGRLRPCCDGEMISRGLHILEGYGGRYGFYSAHAANAMSFAVCSAIGFRLDRRHSYRSYSILIIVWALLVGFSRIFVGKHFFGDVMTGFLVGAAVGFALGKISTAICRKWLDRKD